MKSRDFYAEVDRAQTKRGRGCNACGGRIQQGERYLHLNRNSHLFVICAKCLVIFAHRAAEGRDDLKAQVVADLI